MTTQPTIRTFVAVELPQDVKQSLTSAQEELRAYMGRAANAIRWVRPEGIHLTLQFLGDVTEASIPDIVKALQAASIGSRHVSLELCELGVFPNLQRPRVLWAGLDGTQQAMKDLHMLRRAISEGLTPLGFKADKSFDPHVTLGRVRDTVRAGELADISDVMSRQANRLVPRLHFQIDAISLMKSDLQPRGSIYTSLARLELAQ
ncbi:MAG TPA: RNA 2',3'-cyclic phosphodiesterase [Chloroflexia bacterium]|nr:RNA 2',3'-cyclic phosphodiesterase [Chloroflexia bacterium]